MKKLMRLCFSLCLICTGPFVFFNIRLNHQNTPSQLSDSAGRFTFICPKVNEGYWTSAAYGMKQQDEQQNTNTKFVGPAQYSAEEMRTAILSAVSSDSDGIITVGSRKDSEVIDALETADEAGIPVVLIDTDCDEINRICYIGTNNYEAGRLAGQDMTDSFSGSLHAAVILVSSSSQNQAERLRGFTDELALHPDCQVETVLEANSNFLYLNEVLPQTLEEHPDINAIFCAEEYSSTIVGQILSSMGTKYDNIRVVAFDKMDETLNYVASGQYYSTIVQQSDRMGELAVKLLCDYKKGIFPEKDIIYTDILSIRRENLRESKKYESEGVVWHSYSGSILSNPQQEN